MTPESGTARPRLSLAVLSLVLFVTFLDNTVVAAALADIQIGLHAGVSALQWIVSSYALTFAALMLTFGTLGDHLGRRAVMLGGLGVFTVGSIIGSVANTSGTLIAARVIMGIGAAASEPGTLSMIRQLYPDRTERAQALGVWAAVSGLALAAGPVVGGALVGLWSWRAVFVFNVAVGLVAIAGVYVILPEVANHDRRRLDVGGFVLGASALTAATFATIAGETSGYATWWIGLLYAAALVTGIAFLWVERRAEEPVLDLHFFRERAFTGGNVVAFTGYFATFAVFFFIPLYLQLIGTASPYAVALDFLPMAAAMIAASALSGGWIARVGPGLPMASGCAVAGVGILVTNSMLSATSGVELFGWSLAFVGAGLGVVMVAVTSSVLGVVPAARSGMAASAVNTSRELGAVAGVAVLGSVVNGLLVTNLTHELARIPGLPASLRGQVITAVTTGSVNTSGSTLPRTGPIAAIVQQVLNAANKSFSDALNVVLILAGALLLGSALLAAGLIRGWRAVEMDEP
ncbi:MAG TPA: MFS transporter [Acidimicrobiales bacterium]|nr:MFS transporter [Acidimicrobiales bacterium]